MTAVPADFPILARVRSLVSTTASWTANGSLIIGDGEIAVEKLASGGARFKVGDGVRTYAALPFSPAPTSANMTLRGVVDVTSAAAVLPAPVIGDTVINTTSGTAAAGFGGYVVHTGDWLSYNGTKWVVLQAANAIRALGDRNMTTAAPVTHAIGDAYRNTTAGALHATWGTGTVGAGDWKVWDGTAWRPLGGGGSGSLALQAGVNPVTTAPPVVSDGAIVPVSAAGTPLPAWGITAHVKPGDLMLKTAGGWTLISSSSTTSSVQVGGAAVDPTTATPPANTAPGIYPVTAGGTVGAGYTGIAGQHVNAGDKLLFDGKTWSIVGGGAGKDTLKGITTPVNPATVPATPQAGVYVANAAGPAAAGFGLPAGTNIRAGDFLMFNGTSWSTWHKPSGELRYLGAIDLKGTAPTAPEEGDTYTATAAGVVGTSWTGLTGPVRAGDLVTREGTGWVKLSGALNGELRYLGAIDAKAAAPLAPEEGDTYLVTLVGTAHASWTGLTAIEPGDLITREGAAWVKIGQGLPTDTMNYKGDRSLVAARPASFVPGIGDVVRNTVAGVPDVSWAGIGGTGSGAIDVGRLVVFDGGAWRLMAPVLPPVLTFLGGEDVTAAKPGGLTPKPGDVMIVTKTGVAHASWSLPPGVTLQAGDLIVRDQAGKWDIIGSAADLNYVVTRDGSKDMNGVLRTIGVALTTKGDGTGSGTIPEARTTYAEWLPTWLDAANGGAKLQVLRAGALEDAVVVGNGGHVSINSTYARALDIKSDDASGSGIRFNNTGGINGYIGSGKFTIAGGTLADFSVDASGPNRLVFGTNDTERACIDKDGNVGIGTAAPGAKLEVVGSQANWRRYSSDAVPFYQAVIKSRGAAGAPTTIVIGDAISAYQFCGYNGTSEQIAAAITGRVATTGTVSSTSMPGTLDFATTPDGSNIPVTRVTVDSAGNVGIGTATPGHKLEIPVVAGVAAASIGGIEIGKNGAAVAAAGALYLQAGGTTDSLHFTTNGGAGHIFMTAAGDWHPAVTAAQDLGAGGGIPYSWRDLHLSRNSYALDHINVSARKLKDITGDRYLTLDAIASVTPQAWNWKSNGKPSSGVIAEDIQPLLPELVHEDEEGTLSVSESKISLVMVLSLAKEMMAMREEVAALKAEIAAMKGA